MRQTCVVGLTIVTRALPHTHTSTSLILIAALDLGAGYPCFVVSIAMIGVCTAVIGDVAGHLGCFIYLKDSVNAIAFVALGTSVPGKRKNDDRNIIILFIGV